MLTDELLLRYSRQIMLPDVDIEGQEQWCDARVLIIGLGGLGSPVAMYLAAAGVGHLVLVDDDQVEVSNLQRQIIHGTASIGQSKVVSAEQRIKDLNPHVEVEAVARRLSVEQLSKLISRVDLVVDCSDNFETRFMVNSQCVIAKTPLVSGAAIRMEGQLMTIDPRVEGAPCYQCLYPEQSEQSLTCSESGVLAPIVGVIGSMQAMEVLKVLAGVGEALVGRVLIFDGKTMQWQSLKLKADPHCHICSAEK